MHEGVGWRCSMVLAGWFKGVAWWCSKMLVVLASKMTGWLWRGDVQSCWGGVVIVVFEGGVVFRGVSVAVF